MPQASLPCLLLAAFLAACASHAETVLYVAPTGNDQAAGTAAAPLATLAGARDRLRATKPTGPVTVEFAAGTYYFAAPVEFDAEDSGQTAAARVYRAAPGAAVRLTGGQPVNGWQTVTDPTILNRLEPAARGQVKVADLKGQGITDYGTLSSRGFSQPNHLPEAELFCGDRPMDLSRWPNEGFRKATGKSDEQHVIVDTERLARWTDEQDPWIFAYWHHDWAELYEPLAGVDPANRVLVRSPDIKPVYGITPGRARWYALNLLSEIDQPGEYYLDRQAGKLYFWPPDNGATVLSVGEGIVRGKALSYVTFQGFTMEVCRGQALSLSGDHCQVVGCVVRNTGQRGLGLNGNAQEVYGCDVYDTGEGGIGMSGGDRKTLTPAHNNAENNHVYRYSRRARTYKSAISVSGVGNRIAHNLIHDGPHMALSAGGNDNLVEYNEIHNVVYESGDAGAFYVGRDWTQRGTILRYNYWHDIVGAAGLGGMTIYLDDQHCGHIIEGNLFERCSRAVFIGGGDDNLVDNNVFLGCWRAAHLDNRGMGWQKQATDDPKGTLRTRLAAMPYQSKLWAERYPTLPNILNDDPNIPKRNVFTHNLSAGGSWDDIHRGTREYQTVEDNLVFDADPDWIKLVKDADGRPVELRFKDPAAVQALPFKPLPLAEMGLYQDPRRASWPVENPTTVITLPEPPAPKPTASLPANPVYKVKRVATGPTLDGAAEPAEWQSLVAAPLELKVDYQGEEVKPPCVAGLTYDGTSLFVGVNMPLGTARNLGTEWGRSDAVELAFRGSDGPNAETVVLRGFSDGTWSAVRDAGASPAATARLQAGTAYQTEVTAKAWSAEWRIALSALGMEPGDRCRFNLTVRRIDGNRWVMWRPTGGDSYLVERVGTIELAP